MTRVEQHHDLMLKVARPRAYYTTQPTPRARIIRAEPAASIATIPIMSANSSNDSDDALDILNRRDNENNIYNIISTSNSTDDAATNNL